MSVLISWQISILIMVAILAYRRMRDIALMLDAHHDERMIRLRQLDFSAEQRAKLTALAVNDWALALNGNTAAIRDSLNAKALKARKK